MRPEAKLILEAVSVGNPEKQNRCLDSTLNQENLDWDDILRLAEHHRVLPSLYRALRDRTEREVPPLVQGDLQASYNQNSHRNLFLTKELLRILSFLAENKIPAMPIKGPLLALSLYGNLAYRHIYDLDILVRREHLEKSLEIVASLGYAPEKVLNRREEEKLLRSDCEFNFDRKDGQVHLEVHWNVLPDFANQNHISDLLWENSEQVEVAGQNLLQVNAETLLLLLCVHGGEKHQWWRLKWICDVANLLNSHRDFDWDRTLKVAEALHRTRTLFLGVYLAEILLGAPVPPEVSQTVRRLSLVSDLAGLVHGRLFHERFGLPGFTQWLECTADHQRNRQNGASKKVRILDFLAYLRVVLTPEWADHQALALPTGLAFLHYVSRPYRLFKTHRGRILNRLT